MINNSNNNLNNSFYEEQALFYKSRISIIIYIFLFFLLPDFVILFLQIFIENTMALSAYANLVVYVIGFVVLLFYLNSILVNDYHEVKAKKINLFYALVIGYVIVIFANFASNIITTLLGLTDDSINQTTIEDIIKSGYILPMIISTTIAAPFVEELIFRKSIFGLFRNPYIGLAVSSICFGLIHVIGGKDYINCIPYIIMGVGFGIVYIKNQLNIIPCILLHALVNGISILGLLFLN